VVCCVGSDVVDARGVFSCEGKNGVVGEVDENVCGGGWE
jgi:hypothetical protein